MSPTAPQVGLVALHVRPGHPDFLDLPWHVPLARWHEHSDRIVAVERGICRHEVVFAGYGSAIYAFKELPGHVGEREYRALRQLEQHRLPSVIAAGHARARAVGGEDPEASVLVTRFLESSLPFRTLFMNPGLERYRARLMDALAGLLVRLHLAGFYWGDCSLSNTLFRRDAGELQAFLVDAETSVFHGALTPEQRRHDVFIMTENVAGEVVDLRARGVRVESLEETGERIAERYARLWDEVTREESIAAGESFRIHERIRALNALGFSVGEIELVASEEGSRLSLRTIVTDRDYHRHQLHNLTGVAASERQAEYMLGEIHELHATMNRDPERGVPLSVAAYRWLHERFEPAAKRLGDLPDLRLEPTEVYCQVLEHKWFLSERAGRDIGFDRALEDYIHRARPADAGS